MGVLERDGKWVVRVRRGCVNYFGTFTNRKDADRIHAEKLLEASRQHHPSLRQLKQVSFKELVDSYNMLHIQPHGKTSIAGHVKALIDYFQDKTIHTITRLDIDQLQSFLLKKPLDPATVNKKFNLLRAMFNKAKEWGYIDTHPMVRYRSLPVPKGKLRFLTKAEYDKLMSFANPKLQAIITYAIATGLRKGNIQRLNIATDVDFKNKRIFLGKVKGKKGEGAYIPMNNTAEEVLREMYKAGDVEPFNYEFRNSFDKAVRDAKLEEVTFHTLRHTFASWFVMNGGSLYDLQKLLLHSDSKSTMIYAHLAPDHLLEKASIIDTVLTQTKNTENQVNSEHNITQTKSSI